MAAPTLDPREALVWARHEPELDVETVLDHLAGVSVFPDEDFAEYGLDDLANADLRRWSQGGMTIWLAASPRNVLMNFQMTCD
jgi:hypothetical protein